MGKHALLGILVLVGGCWDAYVRRDAYVTDDVLIGDNATVVGNTHIGGNLFVDGIITAGGVTVVDGANDPAVVISGDGSLVAEVVEANQVDAGQVVTNNPVINRSGLLLTINGLAQVWNDQVIEVMAGVPIVLTVSPSFLIGGTGTFTYTWLRQGVQVGTGATFIWTPAVTDVGSLGLVLRIMGDHNFLQEIVILINVKVVQEPPPPPPPPAQTLEMVGEVGVTGYASTTTAVVDDPRTSNVVEAQTVTVYVWQKKDDAPPLTFTVATNGGLGDLHYLYGGQQVVGTAKAEGQSTMTLTFRPPFPGSATLYYFWVGSDDETNRAAIRIVYVTVTP